MKKNLKLSMAFLLMAIIAGISYQCAEEKGTANVKFYLTDAPAAYDAVNIDIQSIRILTTSDSSETTIELERTGIYNLLDFSGGLDTLLASIELPVGKISQIRLLLGENNSIVVEGETFELKVPSGAESGLKLKVNETLKAGNTYHFWVDFDASRSVKKQGNGKYSLKPVIRMFSNTETGGIKGNVLPVEALPFIWAINGTDTLGTIANVAGEFMLKGVPEGNYTIAFVPQNGSNSFELSKVTVKNGETIDVGTVNLP